jgi:hypothetical protein
VADFFFAAAADPRGGGGRAPAAAPPSQVSGGGGAVHMGVRGSTTGAPPHPVQDAAGVQLLDALTHLDEVAPDDLLPHAAVGLLVLFDLVVDVAALRKLHHNVQVLLFHKRVAVPHNVLVADGGQDPDFVYGVLPAANVAVGGNVRVTG